MWNLDEIRKYYNRTARIRSVNNRTDDGAYRKREGWNRLEVQKPHGVVSAWL